jgi:hypothetical protein
MSKFDRTDGSYAYIAKLEVSFGSSRKLHEYNYADIQPTIYACFFVDM